MAKIAIPDATLQFVYFWYNNAMNRLFAFFTVTLSIIGVASAEWLPEATVRTAAEAFPATDAIGSSVLDGRTVSGLAPRGRLWIVALEPSGHIVMSGSDLANPIVGFSKNDFAEPDPKSPAFAILEGASASMEALEAKGGTRHARWDALLGAGTRGGLHGSVSRLDWKWVDFSTMPERPLDTRPTPDRSYNHENIEWHTDFWEAAPGSENAGAGAPPPVDTVRDFYLDFHESLTTGRPLKITAESVRRRVATMEKIRAAAGFPAKA